MALSGIIAQHSSDIEKRLNDLESRSDHLARVSRQQPMNWYEFQQTGQTNPPKKWSFESIAMGAALGLVLAFGGALLLKFAADMAISSILSPLLIGGAVGGGLIGGMFPSANDKREAQIDAYAKYLDEFEKAQAHAPQRQNSLPVTRPSVPAGRPVGQHSGR